MVPAELFDRYELLVPARFDGGYLLLHLYERVKSQRQNATFTTADVKEILDEIARKYHVPVSRSEDVIKRMLH